MENPEQQPIAPWWMIGCMAAFGLGLLAILAMAGLWNVVSWRSATPTPPTVVPPIAESSSTAENAP